MKSIFNVCMYIYYIVFYLENILNPKVSTCAELHWCKSILWPHVWMGGGGGLTDISRRTHTHSPREGLIDRWVSASSELLPPRPRPLHTCSPNTNTFKCAHLTKIPRSYYRHTEARVYMCKRSHAPCACRTSRRARLYVHVISSILA